MTIRITKMTINPFGTTVWFDRKPMEFWSYTPGASIPKHGRFVFLPGVFNDVKAEEVIREFVPRHAKGVLNTETPYLAWRTKQLLGYQSPNERKTQATYGAVKEKPRKLGGPVLAVHEEAYMRRRVRNAKS
jgi:hypothetical protein